VAASRDARPGVTDDQIAEAVTATYRRRQESPGLFLNTVPAFLAAPPTAQRSRYPRAKDASYWNENVKGTA